MKNKIYKKIMITQGIKDIDEFKMEMYSILTSIVYDRNIYKHNKELEELFLKLNIAMDKLSDLQKQIVQMKLAGKDYSEMSEELGVTHSQIHKNIKKAYDKIRHYAGKSETIMLILSPLFSLLYH